MRIVLVGLGVNAVAVAATSRLLTRAQYAEAAAVTRWLTGSLGSVGLSDVLLLAPAVLLAGAACLVLSPGLARVRMGRDVAAGLGHAPARVELTALLVAVVLSALATAVARPVAFVAFVAFVAPQASLRLFRTAGPTPLAAGLVGALLLLAADTAAQRLPTALPVGIVTAVVGAPALLYLLSRRLRSASA